MMRPCCIAPLVTTLLAAGCGGDHETSRTQGLRTLGGPGTQDGHFVSPRGISVAADLVCVVDKSGRLQALAPDGSVRAVVRILDTRLGFPIGVLAKGRGVVVCDTHNSRLRFFSRDLEELSETGGVGVGPGEFTYPQRVTRDAAGNLYVTEYGDGDSNRVQVFDGHGEFLRQFGGYGFEGGRFTRPMGIVVVGEEVFVADVSDRIVVYGTDGTFRREFGSSGDGNGELDYPYGLCAVGSTLYVAEYGNHRLQRFSLDGKSGGTFGGPGSGPGQFRGPWDVAADEQGLLFVCDTGNHRVVIVDPEQVHWVMET